MIPLDEAQRFVFGLCRPLPPSSFRLTMHWVVS